MIEQAFQIILVLAFGTAIGSFLNVLIWRLPRDEKPNGRSRCPNCKHQLSALDLVPVFSYLISGGKCRYCKEKVSPRYLIIELITGCLFVLALLNTFPLTFNDWVSLFAQWFVISVLIVVFVIDFEHYLILDKVVFPATFVILMINLAWDLFPLASWQTSLFLGSLIGMVVGFLPFYLIWKVSKGKWIGLGDAKFGLFLGAVFGLPQILVTYFLAFIIGTIVSIPLLLAGKKEMGSKLPLGTFLSISALIMLWFGLDIVGWYFRVIGFT